MVRGIFLVKQTRRNGRASLTISETSLTHVAEITRLLEKHKNLLRVLSGTTGAPSSRR